MRVSDTLGVFFEGGEFTFSEVSGALGLAARFENEVCVGGGDVIAVDLAGLKRLDLRGVRSVSYTHLTLPTKA